ncbi:carbon-nitrogen hydrolase family protein [Maritimibacter dapengensis]|uniref:Carbon-nitrogen hydrolase family protein n=1 Tax=Maritimibacter dapengensis TaxID=2836868 RepID=A0ABS6T138_9RHOB|nr:carbon-nitrogen hydrolase family protein [Maritimibacter dapengensis]MBV7378939.1 carbon-nitrogen hydrolase family protein [Maritimibacter dapengensis]
MKIAAATYPINRFDTWSDWEHKARVWVEEAAGEGADLLVFPEYGAMELASLTPKATTLVMQMSAVSGALPRAWDVWGRLAEQHGVHILAPSGPIIENGKPVNRAMFFTPTGARQAHDKSVMTPWEHDPMRVVPGAPPVLMQTALGRIGVLICYDCEFPLAARAMVESGADLILVPSATETMAGFHRVRIGAQARALEGQIVVAHAPTQGQAPWCEVVDENAGCAGIYVPPDIGFPSNGILAQGVLNRPGWTFATVDLAALAQVREAGGVRTRSDWPAHHDAATGHLPPITTVDLR